MALTYKLITGITGQGNPYTVPASSTVVAVTFSGIPSTYTDLIVRWSGRSSASSPEGTYVSFNGTTANFTGTYIIGDGTSPGTGSIPQYIGSTFGGGSTTNAHGSTFIHIPNYASGTTKTFVMHNCAENNAVLGYNNILGGQWANNAAISSITLTSTGWSQYSSFTLYGITKA